VQPLDALTREAAALGGGSPGGAPDLLTGYESEVARVMQICNACRYCEGFCAVFPAMTRRLDFGKADVHYLANLCHSCGACLHACQYAPPHEFAVNVPQALTRVRGQTWADFAWPAAFSVLYRRNGLAVAVALAGGLALFLALAIALEGSLWRQVPDGDFYAVFPHNLMVAMFLPIFVFAIVALALGVRRFWKDSAPGTVTAGAAGETTRDILSLKYLDGGHGEGCNNEDDAFTLSRRRMHHFTFYGFMLCFAATCVGTLYHYILGWHAPYGFLSLPKLLGTAGGIGIVIGTVGLYRLHLRRHPQHVVAEQKPLDLGFIALLLITALTGLLLMALRQTVALPLLLALHLGAVMALFVTLPYGKFAHGVYRSAALLKWAIEKRQPNALALGDE
jgi:citrate/tricarballylate utilization protein